MGCIPTYSSNLKQAWSYFGLLVVGVHLVFAMVNPCRFLTCIYIWSDMHFQSAHPSFLVTACILWRDAGMRCFASVVHGGLLQISMPKVNPCRFAAIFLFILFCVILELLMPQWFSKHIICWELGPWENRAWWMSVNEVSFLLLLLLIMQQCHTIAYKCPW
jgi:hypothetical protein